jgi:hypothetical protein
MDRSDRRIDGMKMLDRWLHGNRSRALKTYEPFDGWHRLWLYWPTGSNCMACAFADGPEFGAVVADALRRAPK